MPDSLAQTAALVMSVHLARLRTLQAAHHARLVLLVVRHQPAAAAQHALAQTVFERIFDKLSSDLYFIVYPLNCIKPLREQCVPVNPTPTFIAAWERVALFVNPEKYGKIWHQ